MIFHRGLTRPRGSHPSPRSHHQRATRSRQRVPKSFNRSLVLFTIRNKLREIPAKRAVVERQVNHPIHMRRPAAQTLQILKRSAMHLRARRLQRTRARIRSHHAQHPVPRSLQFRNHIRPNKSRRTRHKNPHKLFLHNEIFFLATLG